MRHRKSMNSCEYSEGCLLIYFSSRTLAWRGTAQASRCTAVPASPAPVQPTVSATTTPLPKPSLLATMFSAFTFATRLCRLLQPTTTTTTATTMEVLTLELVWIKSTMFRFSTAITFCCIYVRQFTYYVNQLDWFHNKYQHIYNINNSFLFLCFSNLFAFTKPKKNTLCNCEMTTWSMLRYLLDLSNELN